MIRESIIYKEGKRELRDFEKRVNAAASELCLENVGLLDRRGELLNLARKRVMEEGYVLKKGCWRSKVYSSPQSESTPNAQSLTKI